MWKLKYDKLIRFILSGIIIIPIVNKYLNILANSFHKKIGIGISIIVWIILYIIFILVKTSIITTKNNSTIEVEGINLKKKDGTYGTADWGTKEEINEYLGINKRDGFILGKTEENELITLPLNSYLNKNIAVFGSSGSRKSRGFAIPNSMELAQSSVQDSIKKEISLVITDPKR